LTCIATPNSNKNKECHAALCNKIEPVIIPAVVVQGPGRCWLYHEIVFAFSRQTCEKKKKNRFLSPNTQKRMPRRSAPAANDPNVQILRSGGTRSRKLVEKRIVLTTAPKRTKSAKGAKKTKQEKKRGAGKTKNNYLKMVKTAIASNKAHHLHGTTLPAIVKYIQANFQVGVTFRRFVLLTLKKAVAAGQLEKVGARYKFTKAEWRKDHPKKGESASSGSSSKISTEKKSTTTKGRTTTKATAASRKAATETASAAPKKRAPPTQRKTTATTASNEDNVWVCYEFPLFIRLCRPVALLF
jgi:histone H1/5